jgi:hypothetical protein
MSLVSLADKIAILETHALVVMAEGDHRQAVCISEDALPVGGDDLVASIRECLDVYERIADRKYSEGQLAYDGRVWITLSDITTGPQQYWH